MTEKEYIERDGLVGLFLENCFKDASSTISYSDVIRIINSQPAANVQEVVRCKDCANSRNRTDITCVCKVLGKVMISEDYCSYGAKMDEEAHKL